MFSHFLCFDAFGKKPQSGLARTTGTTPLVFSPLLCLNPFGVTPPAGKRRSVQEARRHARRHPFRKDGARTTDRPPVRADASFDASPAKAGKAVRGLGRLLRLDKKRPADGKRRKAHTLSNGKQICKASQTSRVQLFFMFSPKTACAIFFSKTAFALCFSQNRFAPCICKPSARLSQAQGP